MGKISKYVLSISTLGVGAIGMVLSPPVDALYLDSERVEWYSVPEMIEYKAEVDLEKATLCGDDMGCQWEFDSSKMEADPRYRLLEQLVQQQFTVTAVNPSEEYIKVLFWGEEAMLARMGIHEELNIEKIYLGWLEDNVERIYYEGMDPDRYIRGEIGDAHAIYYWWPEVGGDNLILPDAEVRLGAVGLRDNPSGQIIYNLNTGEQSFSAYGRFDYSGCLSHEDYEVGKECKLMFSNERGQAYLPVDESSGYEITTTEVGDEGGNGESEGGNGESEGGNGEPEGGNGESEGGNGESEGGNGESEGGNGGGGSGDDKTDGDENITVGDTETGKSEPLTGAALSQPLDTNVVKTPDIEANTIQTPDTGTNAIKAPDTGANTIQTPDTGANTIPCSKTVEFPWWLVVLIALGDAVVLWLFWPKKSKDSSKKS